MFVPVPTPAEMARWDSAALALGLPEAVLMENAAREAFAVLRRRCGPLRGAHVLLVMGGGNNGGDAACLARHLCDAGALPLVAHSRPLTSGKGAARRYIALARKLGVPFIPLSMPGAWARLARASGSFPPDIVVDGLIGAGFAGVLRHEEASVIAAINALGSRFVLALDVPSGLNAATGKACPDAVRADVTVTFQAVKPGLVVPEAFPYTGEVEVRPIGMPARVMAENPASFRLWVCPGLNGLQLTGASFAGIVSGEDSADPMLFVPTPEVAAPEAFDVSLSGCLFGPAHKGEAGRVLIAGGCTGMSGAPRLAAWGALRGGAGLISVAVPGSSIDFVRQELPDVVTLDLPAASSDAGREWTADHAALLAPVLAQSRAAVIGPGMGRGNGAEDFLEALLRQPARPPLVLDADALFALHVRPALLSLLRQGDVLTPHPGEAATLLGQDGAAVQADRFGALAALQALAPAVWVLKGAGTLIGAPDAPVCICPWHAPHLAVAGSGDVLAGLIGAFLAGDSTSGGERRHADGLAACLAVYLHALAGLSLARRFPLRGNGPRDIADALPQVRPLLGEEPFFRKYFKSHML